MLDKSGVLHSDFPDVEFPKQNVWQFLYPRLKKWGNLTAFVMCDTEESLTYQELIERSLSWAKELKKSFSGHRNPTVAFAMPNNIDCFPIILGSFAAGASVCPFREDATKDLFHIMIKQVKPEILILEPAALLNFKPVIDKTGVNLKIYIRGPGAVSQFPVIKEVLNSGDLLSEEEAGQFSPATLAVKVFSSGTTGVPKCIGISHETVTNSVTSLMHKPILALHAADEASQETIGGTLPLAHIFGLEYFVVLATYFGCRVAYMDGNETEILEYLAKYKPTFIRMRPYTVESISHMDSVEGLATMRTIMTTGCPFEVGEALERLNKKLGCQLFIQNCYGCSEIGAVTMTPIGHYDATMTGKLIPNCKIKFIDLESKEPVTEPYRLGELMLKGPGLMNGYINNPDATKNAVDADGWFHSEDIGYFDEDHFIKVIDRRSDLITVDTDGKISKVSPTEIENVLKMHPDVVDVGVTGVPNHIQENVEVPRAFVIQRNLVKEEEIVKFIEQNAPKEMRLKGGVTFVDKLPRNNMGKLLRKFLKDKVWFTT